MTENQPSTDVARYADRAMFQAEPLDGADGPRAYVLSMNPDPLGSAAAAVAMYRGQVITDLVDVTDQQRREVLTAMRDTKLKAPLEFISIHLLLENVHRGFTHQLVRQRTAVYAQESMRFAVKDGMAKAVHLPPSLAAYNDIELVQRLDERMADATKYGVLAKLSEDDKKFIVWRQATRDIEAAYNTLVNTGMAAEEARGLAPTNVGTRVHFKTDWRNLSEHAGNRLCTQAQFEWRAVFLKIAEAIVAFGREQSYRTPDGRFASSEWQFRELAQFFRPACYLTGKCEFAAMDLDRACKIRNRVDANHDAGRPSSVWHEEFDEVPYDTIVSGATPQSVVRDEVHRPVFIGAIQPAEWLFDPTSARQR